MREKLTLKHPCALDWDSLEIGKEARLCRLCGKQVVDFSKFSNDELIQWFKQDVSKTCGLFAPSQIGLKQNAPIAKNFFRIAAILGGLFSFPISASASPSAAFGYNSVSDTIHVKGFIVKDSKGTPHPFAKIKLIIGKNILIQTTTDLQGKFEFSINLQQLQNEKIKIVIERKDDRIRIEEIIEAQQLKSYFNRAILLAPLEEIKVQNKSNTPSKPVLTKIQKWNPFKRKPVVRKYRPIGCPEF